MEARRYWVRTFGCQMNEHDSERLAGLLEADGYRAADRPEDADVIVVNTCCIRESADNRLYGNLGHLKRLKERNPGLTIAVGGCLAQKDGAAIRDRAPHVDVVFGTHNLHRATELIRRAAADGPVVEITDAPPPEEVTFASDLPARREVPWAAWVTIQVGCDNSCAFCIVPRVRGPEVSRPFGEIVTEVAAAAADGVTEVTLLGQNVNSYGRDLTVARRRRPAPDDAEVCGDRWAAGPRRARPLFADLLRAVGAVPGIRRVWFTSPHPKDLRADTLAAMAETPAVGDLLHLPLQAGSDRVLAAMHRGYTAERWLERLTAARRAVGDLAVTTDVIVGFPGETEDDFARTLEVVAAADLDGAYTFIFSPRPGTEAATMTERFVPRDVCAERFDRLRVVVERSALARNRARVGRTEEVVVEGPSRRDPAVWQGRTRQRKIVLFAPPADPPSPGSVGTAEITGAAPHHLEGRWVETLEGPRHRVRRRIPVAVL